MATLLLNNLEVSNFRAFEHLKIERFGRVNLIVGKNSVGKTSLLESLWIYVNEGSFSTIQEILLGRNEYIRPVRNFSDREIEGNEDSDAFLTALNNLFYGRKNTTGSKEKIKIGPINGKNKTLSLSTDWYLVEDFEGGQLQLSLFDPKESNLYEELIPGLEISYGKKTRIHRLHRRFLLAGRNIRNNFPNNYITVNGLEEYIISSLWRTVALTPLEEDILEALQIITPQVERITLLDEANVRTSRYPIVKIKNLEKPLPLRSLGDGMNRVFGIALALVNSKDGMLIIDEVENGLHFTVQLGLWRLIFAIARRLNVQVFATTHSWDCIQAFQKAASEDPEQGMLIRLDKVNDEIVPVLVDEERLAILTREQIEVR